MDSWIQWVVGLIATVGTPALGYLIVRLSTLSNEISVSKSKIEEFQKEIDKGEKSRKDLFEKNNKLENKINLVTQKTDGHDSKLTEALNKINLTMERFNDRIEKDKQETTKFIKTEIEASKTQIIDKMDMMIKLQQLNNNS